jgi:hypothetical protein
MSTKTPEPPETNGAPPPPAFDLDALRLPTNYAEMANLTKPILTVPVRKPGKQEFIRVHPDPEMSVDISLLRIDGDRDDVFLLSPGMHAALPEEARATRLYLTCNTLNVIAVWPISLPSGDGRPNEWLVSAERIAHLAREKWVRLKSNKSLGAYEAIVASTELPEPQWPDKPLDEIIAIAFQGRVITAPNHPVVRRLRGEIA